MISSALFALVFFGIMVCFILCTTIIAQYVGSQVEKARQERADKEELERLAKEAKATQEKVDEMSDEALRDFLRSP